MASFICTKCGRQKDTMEAVYMDLCDDCEEERVLASKRLGLYLKLGLIPPVDQA